MTKELLAEGMVGYGQTNPYFVERGIQGNLPSMTGKRAAASKPWITSQVSIVPAKYWAAPGTPSYRVQALSCPETVADAGSNAHRKWLRAVWRSEKAPSLEPEHVQGVDYNALVLHLVAGLTQLYIEVRVVETDQSTTILSFPWATPPGVGRQPDFILEAKRSDDGDIEFKKEGSREERIAIDLTSPPARSLPKPCHTLCQMTC